MSTQDKDITTAGSWLRWTLGVAFAMVAVMLVGLALGSGTAHAADDGVYSGPAAVVEEGQCGGGTIAFTVSNNTITKMVIDGSFVGGVPLDAFEVPDLSLAITGDAIDITFDALPGVPTDLTATFSDGTMSGTIGVESLDCVGISFTATLGDPGDTGAPVAGVGPIGSAGSSVTFWAIVSSVMAVVGLAVTGVGARIARKA